MTPLQAKQEKSSCVNLPRSRFNPYAVAVSPLRRRGLASIFVLWCWPSSDGSSIQDGPYRRLLRSRFLCAKKKPPAGWNDRGFQLFEIFEPPPAALPQAVSDACWRQAQRVVPALTGRERDPQIASCLDDATYDRDRDRVSACRSVLEKGGGHDRNRTGVHGFAVRCVTTPPRGRFVERSSLTK